MEEKPKTLIIGALIAFIATTATMYLEKNTDIKFWANQEAFQYQKFIFQERLKLFERYQRIIHSPLYASLKKKRNICNTKECSEYVIEFKTTIALIKEFFPNTPARIINERVKYGGNGEFVFEREVLIDISNAMSKEFDYELTGFGYKGEKGS